MKKVLATVIVFALFAGLFTFRASAEGFDTNMTGFAPANESSWEMTANGYECTSGGGKHLAKTDVVIDGTKSFVYEVSFLAFSGYGAGLAFNVVDVNNFYGIEINTEGHFYFPSIVNGSWSPWYDYGTPLNDTQKNAPEHTIRFEYDAVTRSGKAYLDGAIMQTLSNISLNCIKGNLGLYNEETSVVYTKANYTEILPETTAFETNMNFTSAYGTWVLTGDGYRNISGGRGIAKSDIELDGTKSFVYEVSAKYFSGYGFGFAFGIVDDKNFSAVEYNVDQVLYFPYRINDVWANYADGEQQEKPVEGKEYRFRFEYDADANNAKLYINDVLSMSIDNVNKDRIKGTLGLFTEDADNILYTKAIYTPKTENPQTDDTGILASAIITLLLASAAITAVSKKRYGYNNK